MALIATIDDRTRSMRRRAPVAFQDAVELHFRKSGRHARIVWIPIPVKQWQVRVTMRPGDPALAAWQAGEAPEEPVETIEIVYFDDEARTYRGYELDEIGVSGLIEMLEKADSWSGRGRFGSIPQAMHYQVQSQKEHKDKLKKYLRGEVEAAARSIQHIIKKEPFLTVGIDFDNPSSPERGPTQERD